MCAETATELPDAALVGLGLSSCAALGLIEKIVREAACPAIALLSADDPTYVREAAARAGVFARIVDIPPEEPESAIDITLRRFAEYDTLQRGAGPEIAAAAIDSHLLLSPPASHTTAAPEQQQQRTLSSVEARWVSSSSIWPITLIRTRWEEVAGVR